MLKRKDKVDFIKCTAPSNIEIYAPRRLGVRSYYQTLPLKRGEKRPNDIRR